jgi:hypothetical protein
MAKLGNETRLVLNLAASKIADRRRIIIANSILNSEYKRGFAEALREYEEVFATISIDLERGSLR